MANGTKEFDFKRCPYCGAVYIDSDCVGTRSDHLGVCQLLISCHQCHTTYLVDRAISWTARQVTQADQKLNKQVAKTAMQNVKALLRLALLMPPWAGPPISATFGIRWDMVKPLLSGKTSIPLSTLGDALKGRLTPKLMRARRQMAGENGAPQCKSRAC